MRNRFNIHNTRTTARSIKRGQGATVQKCPNEAGFDMKLAPDWQTFRLGSLVAIQSGNSPSLYNPTSTGRYPFVKVDDLNRCIRIQEDAREFSDMTAGVVPRGATIFAKRGASIATNKVRITGKKIVMDSNMMALIPNSSMIWPQYLFYKIQCQGLYRIADTSPIPQINNKHIIPLLIQVPSLPEQRKIADILTTWDEALEKLDALIAAKERRKKALMQKLLTGKMRVKGFAGGRLTAKLGKLFSERVEQNRIDLTLLSITADRGIVRRDGMVKRDTSSEDKSKYLRIAPGDIGYNTMRMWQGVSALSSLEGIVSPAYTVLIPGKQIDARFAAHFFKCPHTIHLFHRYSQGLVDDTLNLKYPAFATIEVTIPVDIKVQQRIADVLDTCDDELRLFRAQRATIDQQKRGLMQKLLTGAIRVRMEKRG